MELKTRLEEEEIFLKKYNSKRTIIDLNAKRIYTIEDFLYSEVLYMSSSEYIKQRYKAMQRILRYKYLNEPLMLDEILKKEYFDEKQLSSFYDDTAALGFAGYSFYNIAESELLKKGSCKMIDVILRMGDKFAYLRDFYIEYYNNEIIKENEDTKQNEIKKLYELKTELNSLLEQRNELDEKISLLLKQINILEGEETTNKVKMINVKKYEIEQK